MKMRVYHRSDTLCLRAELSGDYRQYGERADLS